MDNRQIANSGPTLQNATAQRMASWARHAQARKLLDLALDALGSDVPAMPLKGVLLGALNIVHPAARPIRDADLLVRGVSLGEAVARLGRAHFHITEVPWSHGYVSLRHPDHGDLWLDLHTSLMPPGLGRLTPRYLFETATRNTTLFARPVYVPAHSRMIVHLIANMVKDRVVRAYAHAPFDLAAALSREQPAVCDAIAQELSRVALRNSGTLAVTWAYLATRNGAVERLWHTLAPTHAQRLQLIERVTARDASDQADLWSRFSARGAADSPWLWLAAPIGGALSVLSWAARDRWLRARNVSDEPSSVR